MSNYLWYNIQQGVNMKEYDRLLNELRTDSIASSVIDKNYGKSIEEIYYLIEYEYSKYESYYILPGCRVMLYPSITERHARKNYYSTFDEAPIYKGSAYINYSALLIDLDTKNKFLFKKPLIFEIGSDIPMDIVELDDICNKHDYDLPIIRAKRKKN